MAQARITVNAVPGSNVLLPINTLVALDNQNNGGEVSFAWTVLDQPPGTADVLSGTAIQSPSFTPRKEGTYLIRLVVNQGLATEQEDRVVCAVRQLKTLERIPAAGETTEADVADGWATANSAYLRRIDALLSDPGVVVGANASGGTVTRGTVMRAIASTVIKTGLPGQETVPGFGTAPATVLGNVDEALVIVESAVDGATSVLNGGLMRVRYFGRFSGATGSPAVGDSIFVDDSATLALTQGTVRRRVGSAMSVGGGLYDVWFNGIGGADIDQTPIDRRYLVFGALGALPNGLRVDGTNVTPHTGSPIQFQAGDVGTIVQVLQRFSAAGADFLRLNDETGVALLRFIAAGWLADPTGTARVRPVDTAGDGGIEVRDDNNSQSAFLERFAGGFQSWRLRTNTDSGFQFRFNAVDSWSLYNNADGLHLQAPGTNTVGVLNLRAPTTHQEAARRNYVDFRYQNLIINGGMHFWQRRTGVSSGNNVRSYAADRWYAHAPAGATNLYDFDRVTSTGLAGFNQSARVTQTGAGLGARSLVQEIDRNAMRAMRLPTGGNRSILLSFWCRVGSGFNGTFIPTLVHALGAALDTQNSITGYTGGSTATTAPALSPAVSTSWQRYVLQFPANVTAGVAALQFVHTPSSNVANNWFEVTGVQLASVALVNGSSCENDFLQGQWIHAGGSYDSDLLMCQRYYEKSYDLTTNPGAAIYEGCLSALFTTGITGVYTPAVRFAVRKWRVPPTVSVYSPATAAAVGNVDDGAVDRPTQTITIGETGCTLQNNAGTAPSTGARCQFHFIADAEI